MSELVTVAVYETRSDAEIVRARLVAGGIDALIFADNEGGLNPGFYDRYGVRVVVVPDRVAEARAMLGIEAIALSERDVKAMIDHTRAWVPNEACGLLAGAGGVVMKIYPLDNAGPSPEGFVIDPADQFAVLQDAEANGWEILGTFHSHPAGPPIPSDVDLAGGGDPAWVNAIVGVRDGRIEVAAYRYRDGEAEVVEIERR
ncbi:MAG: M67 family metallopeptidase [Actinomycetota bacterium]